VFALKNERHQCENPALAAIVGLHDKRYVLDRHDNYQRPENQREDAVNVFRRSREAVLGLEAFAQRVQRTRSDVTVNDAERE
jgi:hypothetical protein